MTSPDGTRTPLLTIAIPTFNRERSLRRQLGYLRAAFSASPELADRCEVVVSNNASTDGTRELLDQTDGLPALRVTHQPENLGLIGNYRFVIGQARGAHLWILSDDDFILPGMLPAIRSRLQAVPDLGLMHFGWGAAEIDDEAVTHRVYVANYYGYQAMILPETGHASCLRLAGVDPGGLMFMSANVLRTDLAKVSLRAYPGPPDNLALPIWVATFASCHGGFYFHKEVSLFCRHAAPRWSASYFTLFYGDIPLIFQQLRGLGLAAPEIMRKHFSLLNNGLVKFARQAPFRFVKVWAAMPLRILYYSFGSRRSL